MRVDRRTEQFFGLADLNKLAEIHDRGAMAQPAHREDDACEMKR